MILEAAIVNITRNLDVLIRRGDGEAVSSHEGLKEKGLGCLLCLMNDAPSEEFKKFLKSEDYEILSGYLLNVLCQLAKNDRAKTIKIQSLEVIFSLVKRIEQLHCASTEKCSIKPIVSALPGVTSTLFRIIMSDTKLPRNLLVIATRTLAKFIKVAFQPCEHKVGSTSLQLEGKDLTDICDNLALRFGFLVDYVSNNNANLPNEVKSEMLDFCEIIACQTRAELLSSSLKSIVKYVAFSSSMSGKIVAETQLKIMLIIDSIQAKIRNCDSAQLNSVVMSCLFNLLDNLEEHSLSMLLGERESELSILLGFLKILPSESLTMFLELNERRIQFIKIMTLLTEFSTEQPFLLLTDAKVGPDALETCDERIYTVEKRFTYLSLEEVCLLSACNTTIGEKLEWLCLEDIFRNDLRQFSSSSNLYVTNLFIEGCIKRSDINFECLKFVKQSVDFYIDQTQELYSSVNESFKTRQTTSSQDVLKIVIAIETLVNLVDLNLKLDKPNPRKVIILKSILCPLLNWASSSNRAVSEAALSSLSQIAHLYENDSIKTLIESNIDYIVDGVMHMLDNFRQNSEVTNVLAITFKLSSIECFYYFKDIYEKVFRLLGIFYQTDKSKSIILLFYRTLSILCDWKNAKGEIGTSLKDSPLNDESCLKSIIQDLDIDRRLKKLDLDSIKARKIRQRIEEMEVAGEDESRIIDEIKAHNSSKKPQDEMKEEESAPSQEDAPKKKAVDVVLTEKILGHCVNLLSSNYAETKIIAMKTASLGFKYLRDDEDTLLPLVHQLWAPLVSRLTGDYSQNLEINLCAFECLVSMALYSKDFIKSRTLDLIIPRLCLFLESQAKQSHGKKDYGPYSMTIAYKCQLRILTHLGALAYHIQLAYSSLWRVVKVTLIYLDCAQIPSLREAARTSLHYMIALDADCVWYFAKKVDRLNELPFELIYEEPLK